MGKENAEELIDLEERIEGYAKQLREIGEAVAVGERALTSAGELIDGLNSTDSLGVFKFEGERSAEEWIAIFDEAQGWIEKLQIELRDFKTELCDVTINSDIRRQSDDYLKFADTFLDHLFSDWAIQKQRAETRYYVEDLRDSVQAMLAQLSMESGIAQRAKARAESRYDDMLKAAINVRKANMEDAEQLALLNTEFNGEGKTSLENIKASLETNKGEIVIVAEEAGAINGFLCLQLKKSFCYDAYMPEITELYVRAEHRKKGIAGSMIAYAELLCASEYPSKGISVITGAENSVAQTAYERIGFRASGEKYLWKAIK